jgi:hypothetical protein
MISHFRVISKLVVDRHMSIDRAFVKGPIFARLFTILRAIYVPVLVTSKGGSTISHTVKIFILVSA